MELDTCTSYDALLMNIFCYPGALRNGGGLAHLGAEPDTTPIFGYRARVPLANGRFDRTEVDMRLDDLVVEAKLTESDFSKCRRKDAYGLSRFLGCIQLAGTTSEWHALRLLATPTERARSPCPELLVLRSG